MLADHPPQHPAVAFDGFAAGVAIGVGQPAALGFRKTAFQRHAFGGQLQKPLAAVLPALVLDDELLAAKPAENPGQALFCDFQDGQQFRHIDARIAPEKINDPVMRPSEAVFGEDGVRFCRKVAIGEIQQLHPLANILFAQKQWIDA